MRSGPMLQRCLGWAYIVLVAALTVGVAAVIVIAACEGVAVGG